MVTPEKLNKIDAANPTGIGLEKPGANEPKAPKKVTKPKKNGMWPHDVTPTRDEIVHAVRTLTSLASCWLDRDPEKCGSDVEQVRLLREICDKLKEVEQIQQKQVALVLATNARDVLAVELGARAKVGEDGQTCLVQRAAGRAKAKSDLPPPHIWERSTVAMHMAQGPFTAHDAVLKNLASQFAIFTDRTRVSDQTIEKVREVAQKLSPRTNLQGKTKFSKQSPSVAAGVAIHQLGFHDVEYTAGPAGTEKRWDRACETERHPDRPPPDGIDCGLFFGARMTSSGESGQPLGSDARTWAAARLVAEVFGASEDVVAALARPDNGWPGVWRLAACGRAETAASTKALERLARLMLSGRNST